MFVQLHRKLADVEIAALLKRSMNRNEVSSIHHLFHIQIQHAEVATYRLL